MRNRSPATDHDAAVARRLELLTSELASVRDADPWAPHAHTRIRVLPDPEPDPWSPPGDVGAESAPLPHIPGVPGRHASRRRRPIAESLSGSVSETLRDRVPLGAGHVAVVAVVAVVGLVVTCWWLVRSGGHEVTAPMSVSTPRAALATPDGSAGGPGATAGSSTRAAKIVVDVVGKVRRPGIAVLRSGDRVVDAIRAAGGVRPGADVGSLNLAQPLTDGEQIVVGASGTGPAGDAPVSGAPVSGAPVTGLVNLNTADETALESLPEVGPVTAQAIMTWRSEHGGFSSVNQLLDVDGIGDATLAKLTPYVTL